MILGSSSETSVDRARIVWDALELGRRDDVKDMLPEIVEYAGKLQHETFPDQDRYGPSVREWVTRGRIVTLECRFCRAVLDEMRRPRASGLSIDSEPWSVEEPDPHGERCAAGVLGGLMKPRGVRKKIRRTRTQLAKLPMRLEMEPRGGDSNWNTTVKIFGEGFHGRRIEVWFGEERHDIVKRNDRELVVEVSGGSVDSVPVRVKIGNETIQLRQHFSFWWRPY